MNPSSKLEQLNADHSKASQRERQTQLTAPVAGIVQQLAVHSIGGVVTSAQPLMVVVADSADGSTTVTAEITIANQDIGFVNTGQMAEVRLKTFTYTKYGTVAARVDGTLLPLIPSPMTEKAQTANESTSAPA